MYFMKPCGVAQRACTCGEWPIAPIAAGFGVLKAKFDKDMAGPMGKWVPDFRQTGLGNNDVMLCMNVIGMEALGAIMMEPLKF